MIMCPAMKYIAHGSKSFLFLVGNVQRFDLSAMSPPSTAKLYPLKSEPSSLTSVCDQHLIIADGSKCRMFHK